MSIGAQGVVAYGDDGEVTRTDFWQRVHALVARLTPQRPHCCALVCASNVDFAVGLVALAHLRCRIILPPAASAGSLAACDVDVDAVVTDEPATFASFNSIPLVAPDTHTPSHALAMDDTTPICFYSSGSSGRPTAYQRSLGTHRELAQWLETDFGSVFGDATVVSTVPHHHRFGFIWALSWPLLVGRPFYEQACPMPGALARAVNSQDRASVVISSPAFLSRVAASVGVLPRVEKVRTLASGGAPLPRAVIERLRTDWGRAPQENYGSTETGSLASRDWNAVDGEAVPPWRPFSFVQTQLREEAAGQRLWVRTPHLDRWMPTGDLARHCAEGSFQLLGRADDVIKVEDRRISLNEICTRLVKHEWVRDARLVRVVKHRIEIGALVILNKRGQHALAQSGKMEVQRALKQWLSEVFVSVVLPRRWRFVEAWPDNDMGKMTQAALVHLFGVNG